MNPTERSRNDRIKAAKQYVKDRRANVIADRIEAAAGNIFERNIRLVLNATVTHVLLPGRHEYVEPVIFSMIISKRLTLGEDRLRPNASDEEIKEAIRNLPNKVLSALIRKIRYEHNPPPPKPSAQPSSMQRGKRTIYEAVSAAEMKQKVADGLAEQGTCPICDKNTFWQKDTSVPAGGYWMPCRTLVCRYIRADSKTIYASYTVRHGLEGVPCPKCDQAVGFFQGKRGLSARIIPKEFHCTCANTRGRCNAKCVAIGGVVVRKGDYERTSTGVCYGKQTNADLIQVKFHPQE
jgi:hypothetical protein